MDTTKMPPKGAPRSGSRLSRLVAVGAAGLVLGLLLGTAVLSGGSTQTGISDPAHLIASVIDDLNTAYVYGDMATIDEIFGEELVFNPGQGPDLVGPAGADFFKANAGDGAIARRVTEPVANSNGGHDFLMELRPPNRIQPILFEVEARVEDGRVARIQQGELVSTDDQAGG